MKSILRHKIAKATLIGFYILQVIFAASGGYKEWSIYIFAVGGILIATTLILLPALITYKDKKYIASTAATLSLLPFVVYANVHEYLLPYKGGGASMAYVIVFLFGVPFSILVAVVSSYFDRDKNQETAR
jgi:hypothetical protein